MLARIPRGSFNTKNAPRRREMGEEMIWRWSRYFLKVETKLGHPPKSSCSSLNPTFTDGSIVSPHNKSSSNPSTPILSFPPFSQSPKNLNRRTHFPRLPPRCKQNSRTHTRNISRDRPSTTQPNLGHLPLCLVRFFQPHHAHFHTSNLHPWPIEQGGRSGMASWFLIICMSVAGTAEDG